MATIEQARELIKDIRTLDELEQSTFNQDERTGIQNAVKRRRNQLIKEHELFKQYEQMMEFERQHYGKLVAGIDEAGRGPLAGEVVAAAVILPEDFYLPGLNDSKQLSLKKRMEYKTAIMSAADYGVGIATVAEIDSLNIYQATKIAMRRAVENLKMKPEHLLIDAMELNGPIEETAIVKGDARSASIAGASIIAKTTRDAMMDEYNEKYPGYDFDKNKGYGTAGHLAGLDKNGVSPIHRRTFEPVKSKFAEK